MPDITMCTSKECLYKDKCYRFKAVPSEYWQSYSSFYNLCIENNYGFFVGILEGDYVVRD